MIPSRDRCYIFVHIPKTGGTSLARAMEGRAVPGDILIGDTPRARRRRGHDPVDIGQRAVFPQPPARLRQSLPR